MKEILTFTKIDEETFNEFQLRVYKFEKEIQKHIRPLVKVEFVKEGGKIKAKYCIEEK